MQAKANRWLLLCLYSAATLLMLLQALVDLSDSAVTIVSLLAAAMLLGGFVVEYKSGRYNRVPPPPTGPPIQRT